MRQDMQSALELVRKAFARARRKGPGAKSMTLAVLNNRLLQMTGRSFRPSDYGAKDVRALLEALAPHVSIDSTREPVVTLVGSEDMHADDADAQAPAADAAPADEISVS